VCAIISRLRAPNGAIPLVASYDVREKVWNPPIPPLFQHDIGSEHRAFTPTPIRKLLINALAATRLTNADGVALTFSPHDFRRSVRCSLLRPDPGQRTRLADIRDNLIARIAEAEREGRLGEVEGLRVSLAGAEEKIAQLDARQERRSQGVPRSPLVRPNRSSNGR
jgi:hypothetical protein